MKCFCVYWMEAQKSICWMSSYVGPLQKCWSPCLEHLFIFSWGERGDLRTHDKARQQILESTATGTPESLSSKHPRKWRTAIEYRVEWSGERGQKCFWEMRLTWSAGFRERENWNWALKRRINRQSGWRKWDQGSLEQRLSNTLSLETGEEVQKLPLCGCSLTLSPSVEEAQHTLTLIRRLNSNSFTCKFNMSIAHEFKQKLQRPRQQ